jgi:CHAT domain/SIR2-like domain
VKDTFLDFQILRNPAEGGFEVRLVADAWQAQAAFGYDLENPRLNRVVKGLEANQCSLDNLRDIGIALWSGLMVGEVGKLFDGLRQGAGLQEGKPDGGRTRFLFRLTLPPELEPLPWEALHFERGFGFLSSHPDHAVVRAPSLAIDGPVQPPMHQGQVRVLAVAPAGSGLDLEREWNNLDRLGGKLPDRMQVQRLSGRVTPDLLRDTLRRSRWDVLHFSGHGELTDVGRTVIRLNDEEGRDRWLDGEAFSHLLVGTGVRLAVLNCCMGGSAVPHRSMSGLGPFLLRAGVPAVVAMRYEITDAVAIRFAERFYSELLGGLEPGRVDLALEHARESIFINQTEDVARDFVTPALYLAPGCEQLFALDVAATEAPEAVTIERRASTRAIDVPPELLKALQEGRCVPVLGPRILAGLAARGLGAVTPPRQLARRLAEQFDFPHRRDFELCEAAGDWMDLWLLERVCQHSEAVARKANELYKLAQAIQEAFRAAPAPSVLTQVAAWNFPGVFYLYFDGLLEEAFAGLRRPVRVIHGVDEAVPPGESALLVHVLGSHKDTPSLVLTEQDHDRLWDRIGRMDHHVTELIRGHLGRSLFFLGSSPRDPLVKRLTSKLLEQASTRTMGPLFFLCRDGEKGDPYWDGFPVIWLEGEVEPLVAEISARLG